MAQSPLGGFANLSRYQQAAVQPQPNIMDQFVQALNQGISLAQLPQTLQQENQLKQQALVLGSLKTALAQQQLNDLQNPEQALARKFRESLAAQAYDPTTGIVPGVTETVGTPGTVAAAGDLTGITERPQGVAPGTPIQPILDLNGRPTGFGRDQDGRVKALTAEAAIKELLNPSKKTFTVTPTATGLSSFQTSGPGAGRLTPLMEGEAQVGNVSKADAATKVTRFSDAQGDLWNQPETGGIVTPALKADGTQINAGVANTLFNADGGVVTIPSKTEGGTTPLATPLMTVGEPTASTPTVGGGFVPIGATQPVGTVPPPPAPSIGTRVQPPKKAVGNKDLSQENALEDRFLRKTEVKDFTEIRSKYQDIATQVLAAKTNPKQFAGDAAIVDRFAAIVNPRGRVTQGQVQLILKGRNLASDFYTRFNRLLSNEGGVLTQPEREALLDASKGIFKSHQNSWLNIRKDTIQKALDNNLDPEHVVGTDLPIFDTEQEARSSGLKNGNRAIINGRAGTLE